MFFLLTCGRHIFGIQDVHKELMQYADKRQLGQDAQMPAFCLIKYPKISQQDFVGPNSRAFFYLLYPHSNEPTTHLSK